MKMRIKFDEYRQPLFEIDNEGKILDIEIYAVDKKFNRVEHIFDHINEYLSTLDQVDLNRYFRNCRSIKEEFDGLRYDASDIVKLRNRLNVGIESLNYPKFMEWFMNHTDTFFSKVLEKNIGAIYIPDTVKDEFIEHPDKGDTEDKTYIKKDMLELVGMITFIRMFIPYFANYLGYMQGVNEHPLLKVFELFGTSQIEQYGGPIEKLREYINVNYESIHKTSDKQDRIIDAGLSDEDAGDALVARAIFERLIISDFVNGSGNPITACYNLAYYGGKFNTGKGPLNGIKLKSGHKDSEADEDYVIFENFRKRTQLAPGSLEVIRISIMNFNVIVSSWGIKPEEFDWTFFEELKKDMVTYMNHPVDDTKVYMLGWLLKDNINPRALAILDNRTLVELTLLAKTFLYMKGMPVLGSFFGAIYDRESNFINMNTSSKNTLSKNTAQRLASLYEYQIHDRGIITERPIIDFAKNLSNMPWKVYGYNDSRVVSEDGYLLTPNNITDLLVDYVELILSFNKNKIV